MRILQQNLEWTTDTFLFISYTTNVLLFKFRCNIFIGVRIIKEMPGSVASGTHCTGWGISWLTSLYPTNGLLYAPGSQCIVVGDKAARNAWHGCHGRHLGSNFGILNGRGGACDMSFNTSLISEEQWWCPSHLRCLVEKLLFPKGGKFPTFRTQ